MEKELEDLCVETKSVEDFANFRFINNGNDENWFVGIADNDEELQKIYDSYKLIKNKTKVIFKVFYGDRKILERGYGVANTMWGLKHDKTKNADNAKYLVLYKVL